jgi:XapX domain-containing protein
MRCSAHTKDEGVSLKAYLLSLLVGIVVGVVYALFQVRSPAPPVIALIGLLGILIGEQVPSYIKQVWIKDPPAATWLNDQVKPHAFGSMPSAHPPSSDVPIDGTSQAEQGKQ